MLVTAEPNQVKKIDELADHYGFYAVRIGATGGDRLQISVYGDTFVDAPVSELRAGWAGSLSATLHDEVTA